MPQLQILQSLLWFSPNINKKIFKNSQNSTQICFSRHKRVTQNQVLEEIYSKSSSQIFSMTNLTQSAAIYASSVRIILPLPVSLTLIKSFLSLFLFLAGSAFAKTSTSYGIILLKIFCPKVSSKPIFKQVSKTLGYLYILFGIRLGKIIDTNRKKCRIRPPTLNICNLFLWSSMLAKLSKNLPLFKFFEIGFNLELPLKQNKIDEIIIVSRSWSKK